MGPGGRLWREGGRRQRPGRGVTAPPSHAPHVPAHGQHGVSREEGLPWPNAFGPQRKGLLFPRLLGTGRGTARRPNSRAAVRPSPGWPPRSPRTRAQAWQRGQGRWCPLAAPVQAGGAPASRGHGPGRAAPDAPARSAPSPVLWAHPPPTGRDPGAGAFARGGWRGAGRVPRQQSGRSPPAGSARPRAISVNPTGRLSVSVQGLEILERIIRFHIVTTAPIGESGRLIFFTLLCSLIFIRDSGGPAPPCCERLAWSAQLGCGGHWSPAAAAAPPPPGCGPSEPAGPPAGVLLHSGGVPSCLRKAGCCLLPAGPEPLSGGDALPGVGLWPPRTWAQMGGPCLLCPAGRKGEVGAPVFCADCTQVGTAGKEGVAQIGAPWCPGRAEKQA